MRKLRWNCKIPPEAHRQAGKAMAMGVQGELRAQALWIKGSCEHQAKDFKSSRINIQPIDYGISQ